jgi:outer membrane protein assembly factor BamB
MLFPAPCYDTRVKNRRSLAVGALLFLASTLLAACGGVQNPEGWASPAVDGSTIYYFPKKDRISAITLAPDGSATANWTFPDKNRPEQKDLKFDSVYDTASDATTIYMGSWNGRLFALNRADGSPKWFKKDFIQGGIVGGPVLADGRLIVGTTANRLYVLDPATGEPAPGWSRSGITFDGALWAPPVAASGRVYVATMGGEVHALDLADGRRLWPQPFRTEGAIADLSLLDDGHLFVPSLDKRVSIVDTATGTASAPAFSTGDWVWSRPAYLDGKAYFGDFSGSVYAVDITTGQQAWKYEADSKIKSSPILLNGVLMIASREPAIYFLDANSGAYLNRVPIVDAGTIRAGATVQGTRALFATTKGKLWLADPASRRVDQLLIAGEKP